MPRLARSSAIVIPVSLPHVTTAALPIGIIGVNYLANLDASGGTPTYLWSSGALPGGLSLSSAGVITGTPTTATTNQPVSFSVVDAANIPSAPTSLNFTIVPPLSITTLSLPNGAAGTAYNATLAATGGQPPYTWSITGQDSHGFPILNTSTGALSGTPTASEVLTIGATVTDTLGLVASTNLPLTVQPAQGANPPPARIFQGTVTSSQVTASCWPPSPQTAVTFTVPTLPATAISATLSSPINPGVYEFTFTPNTDTFGNPIARSVTVASDGVSCTWPATTGQGQQLGLTQTGALYDAVDWYNMYRQPEGGGTPVLCNPGGHILPTSFFNPPNTASRIIVHTDKVSTPPPAPNTAYQYYFTAVLNGIESAPSPLLHVTTLANGPAAAPTPAADPSTWLVPYALPTGVTWTCTSNASGLVAGTDNPPGNGKKNKDCNFNYALANSNPAGGDVIVLTAGLTYPGNVTIPAYTGTNGWTYIVSSQDPGYQSGGTLPAINTAYPIYVSAATSALAAGAVSATLTAPWSYRSGVWVTIFAQNAGVIPPSAAAANGGEIRTVTFTNGSSTITWDGTPTTNGLVNPTLGPIVVEVGPWVTPSDLPSMPQVTISPNGPAINLTITQTTHSTKVRLVGIAMTPTPSDQANNLTYGLSSPQAGGGRAPADHVYADRCLIGNSSFNSTYSYVHGGMFVYIDHFYVSQTYIYGIYNSSGSDPFGIGQIGGGPTCIEASFIEAASEGCVTGGGYVDPNHNILDLVRRNLTIMKQPSWSTTFNTTIAHEVKNGLECKTGTRVHDHHNRFYVNFYGPTGGQHARWCVYTARDQQASVARPVIQTNPWCNITDVDNHDNVAVYGGALAYFTQDTYDPGTYVARCRVQNNAIYVSPWPFGYTQEPFPNTEGHGIYLSPNLADIIIDHNTIITNPANVVDPGTYCGVVFFSTSGTLDRIQITNNILDGVDGVGNAGSTHGSAFLTAFFTNLTFSNNLMPKDTHTWPAGSNTFQNIAYTAIGFQNWQSINTVPNLPRGDYNVVSGTYATASTTGGPIGAIFATLQFPLLGAYLIDGVVDPGTLAHTADMDALIISGYEGDTTLATRVGNAKTANPNMVVTAYVALDPVPNTSGFAAAFAQMNGPANWWARASFPSGAVCTEFGGENCTNIIQSRTSTAAPFTGGTTTARTVRQWMAAHANHLYGPGIAPTLDGIFTDNVFFQPRAGTGGNNQADWNETGTAVANSSVQVPWRAAYTDWDAQVRAAMGASYFQHWANSADWGSATGQVYAGVFNGGVIESQEQFEAQTGGSWAQMMGVYKATMISVVAAANGKGPYPIFAWAGASITNYAAFRYAFCSCLLDNAYFYWNVNSTYNAINWFDEQGFNLGSAISGPNNPSNGTYSSGGLTAWNQGVWRRDFANGIALVNPRGNGAKSVTLEVDVWRLRGTQDPVTNNAAKIPAGTAFTMADAATAGTGGSGLVLSRTVT